MRILFPTDGSNHASLAEAMILKLPGMKGSSAHVITVVPSPVLAGAMIQPAAEAAYMASAESLWDELRKSAEKRVERAANRLEAVGLTVTTEVFEGDPSNVIIDTLKETRYDLVVAGSRGENALAGALLGSVARKLVNHANTNVLIVRSAPDQAPEEAKGRLEGRSKLRLMLATDDSEGSQKACEFVCSFGPNAFEEIFTICAEPIIPLPADFDPSGLTAELGDSHNRALEISKKAAETLKPCAPKVTALSAMGRPSNVIIESADNHEADMIVMGAHRHGALERFLLGSIAYEVATTANCSVLVVRLM